MVTSLPGNSQLLPGKELILVDSSLSFALFAPVTKTGLHLPLFLYVSRS